MSKRYDVVSPRERGDKTFWQRVGTAFVGDNGKIGIEFDALPLPDKDGRCRVQLFEPRDNTSNQGGAPRRQSRDDGGDIPF